MSTGLPVHYCIMLQTASCSRDKTIKVCTTHFPILLQAFLNDTKTVCLRSVHTQSKQSYSGSLKHGKCLQLTIITPRQYNLQWVSSSPPINNQWEKLNRPLSSSEWNTFQHFVKSAQTHIPWPEHKPNFFNLST